MLIKVFLLFIISTIIVRLFFKFKSREINFSQFWVWLFFWLIASLVVIFPEVTVWPANYLGVGRGADLVVYLALIFIFYLMFKFLLRIEKMEKNITLMVRENSLNEYERNNKK